MPKIIRRWWVLVLVLAGCTHKPDHATSFRNANAQLRHGKYAQAIRRYQQLERQGVRQPALFCNLGTACYQAGRVGWAVYYYEKALALAPLDAQLLANRRAVQPPTLAPVVAPRWWLALPTASALRAADASAALALVSFLLSSVLYAIGLVGTGGRRPTSQPTACQLLLLASALLLVAAGGLLLPWHKREAIIILPKTALRSGPSSLASKMAEADEGEKVEVQTTYRGWLKVQTARGAQGWVAAPSAARLQE